MDSRSFVEAVDFYYKLEQYNNEMKTMANLSDYKIYNKFFFRYNGETGLFALI